MYIFGLLQWNEPSFSGCAFGAINVVGAVLATAVSVASSSSTTLAGCCGSALDTTSGFSFLQFKIRLTLQHRADIHQTLSLFFRLAEFPI